LGRLQAALHDCHVAGVATNVDFLRWLVREPDFVAGKTATDFLDKHHWTPPQTSPEREVVETLAAAGALQSLGSWRLGSQRRSVRFSAPTASVQAEFDWRTSAWLVGNGQINATVRPLAAPSFELTANGRSESLRAWRTDRGIELAVGDPPVRHAFALDALEDVTHAGAHASGQGGSGSATAPMSGTVVKVDCEPGAQVKAHQVLAVIEAMKMEHAVAAPFDGRVQSVNVRPGDRVDAGDVLVEVEPAA
jgi:geranyl-CoA carboxylase alpha subunit